MEIEKTLTVAAPREQVWALLLDPRVMAGAVPGMQSIDVLSPTEYVAVMHQTISFIKAKFKLRTRITEQRAPEYLCAEGSGEDTAAASSLKQRSEMFLTATPDGGTELRIKARVDLLGRLGTFGLSVMKTKADRLWDEFGNNLKARIEAGDTATVSGLVDSSVPAAVTEPAASPAPAPQPSVAARVEAPPPLPPTAAPPRPAVNVSAPATTQELPESGFWSRLLGGRGMRPGAGGASARSIRVEVRQLDRTITVEWPVEAAGECRQWLQELMTQNTPA